WGGMENLSWIPGSVGAAPVQNIGAYGTEACCVITAVECYVPAEHRMMRLSAEACCFGYRDSIFKRELQGRVVITAVEFALSLKPLFHVRYGELSREVEQLGGMSLEHIRQAVIAIRKHKLPDPKQLGNTGSFFKNPVVSRAVADALTERFPDMPRYEVSNEEVKLAAGWLIDQSGWRGRREGKVGVHESQALVLVNYGGATGAEVMALAHRIQEAVATQFGVQIEMEVNLR
ncbi:MAG: UDP-N-acetylmuramate dehydrogenase, partial [Alistipes sp.]|nr:UDP-N-acetylmuramate dehydrogenase [Alistipes sp.]